MKVYFDFSEMGKSAIACNCCGELWSSGSVVTRKGKNAEAHAAERVANKNGWLIHEMKNFHICETCAGYMVKTSYYYKAKEKEE